MTEQERDQVLDEVLVVVGGMSGNEWAREKFAPMWSASHGQMKVVRERIEAMKSVNHLMGA